MTVLANWSINHSLPSCLPILAVKNLARNFCIITCAKEGMFSSLFVCLFIWPRKLPYWFA